jgi:hypothetical protein
MLLDESHENLSSSQNIYRIKIGNQTESELNLNNLCIVTAHCAIEMFRKLVIYEHARQYRSVGHKPYP